MVTIVRTAHKILATASTQVPRALSRWLACSRERQMQRAWFDAEMYRGMYRHSSKNDDDLPVVR